MRIISAIAIIVLATACASSPVDPFAQDTLEGSDIEQTADTQDEQPTQEAPSPDAARARR
jgi:hypothetical protein